MESAAQFGPSFSKEFWAEEVEKRRKEIEITANEGIQLTIDTEKNRDPSNTISHSQVVRQKWQAQGIWLLDFGPIWDFY